MPSSSAKLEPLDAAAHKERLLVAIIGLSPAILTETVYALCSEPEPEIPDRVIAVTTRDGKRRLEEALFADGGWDQLLETLQARLGKKALVGKLRFGPVADCIRVIPSYARDRDLEDIRTADDNAAVADFLMETLRGPSEEADLAITASLAGGRKTMSALLLSVMSLLGRFGDRVIHVLAQDPWDRVPGFLFPGCPGSFVHPDTENPLNSATARLSLAEVPFVPLRYLFAREIGRASGSYRKLVDQIRRQAAEIDSEIDLEIDCSTGSIAVNGIHVSLSKMEFAFYAALADRAVRSLPTVAQYIDLENDVVAFARKWLSPDDFGHWSHEVVERNIDAKEQFRRYASSIKGRLRELGFGNTQIYRLAPQRGRLSIDLPPEQIAFLPKSQPADRPKT